MNVINVEEVLNLETGEVQTDSIITYKQPVADPKAAFERLGCLKYTLEKLQRDINATDIQNTEESWHRAYESITRAFNDCIAEEKRIICNI